MRIFICATVFLSLLLIGCEKSELNNGKNLSTSEQLFTERSAKETGLHFVNKSIQNTDINVLGSNYAECSGGLAVGDFNNDGLQDIFLTGNQVADKIYINKGNLKFEDITQQSGIKPEIHGKYMSWSTGVTLTDINQDGWQDIYVSKSGPFSNDFVRENKLYINNKDLTFTEAGKEYGIADSGNSIQAAFFDMDKDNDLDLYVSNHSAVFNLDINKTEEFLKDPKFEERFTGNLYKNENGKFRKITKESGVSFYGFGLGLVASDLNEDGNIDIYVGNDFSRPDKMFINQGNNKFKDEISKRTNHTSYYSMGCEVSDINNDGLPEIGVLDMAATNNFRSKTFMPSMQPETFNYLHDSLGFQYQYMYNTLQLNNGNGTFSDIARLSGLEKSDWSWGILFADFDNDGFKDCFVSNGNRYLADNDFWAGFRKEKKENGGNFSIERKEYWISKLLSSKVENLIYKNNGDLTFTKINKEWGISGETISNAAAYADFDNDGDLDLVVNNVDAPVSFYENNGTNNNYLQVNLLVNGQNQLAHNSNARVYLYYGDEVQMNELIVTRGFQSAVAANTHFGLGSISKIDSLVVKWADKTKQVYINVMANQILNIDKEDKNAIVLEGNTSKSKAFFTENNNLNRIEHRENDFNDFDKEILLPHKNSQHGPSLSVADVNGDGLEDYFIGGAKGQAGTLMLQTTNGNFTPTNNQPWSKDKNSEDTGSLFFDYDNDGDLDLYVVSGGNEYEIGSSDLQDRLYRNDSKDGNLQFSKTNGILPKMHNSSSCVVSIDYNQDGKLDLFVGGRMKPGQYPFPDNSYLLKNEGAKFTDVTNTDAPGINEIGLVTTAITTDINQDGLPELVVAGEWTSIHIFDFKDKTAKDISPSNIADNFGWWSALTSIDIDNDGDMDLVAGNLGLNYKYKASHEEPFHIYANDFDKSGNIDIVLSYFNEGTEYPLRGRECSSQQMPELEEKFPTYASFASATVNQVYGDELNSSYHQLANNFASILLVNEGNGKFTIQKLPNKAQISCINAFIVEDLDKDGYQDLLLAGNLFASEPETPRNDANVGLVLMNDNSGNFQSLTTAQSGFFVPGDVKDLALIKLGRDQTGLIVANNNDHVQYFVKK